MTFWRLTPAGRGGVALFCLEGPGWAALLERAFERPNGNGLPAESRVALGELRAPNGEALDEVLLIRLGSDRFELACHGGPGVQARIEDAFSQAGATRQQLLPPGDRIQQEARDALPRAATELACQVLLRQLNGSLRHELEAIVELLPSSRDQAVARLETLHRTASIGLALLEPPEIVLSGLPNAGKSSLMNALLGRDRVLVSDQAGTTRDPVGDLLDLGGVPVRLVDTAGRRATQDPLEAAGVALAQRREDEARLRLVVVDGTQPSAQALALARRTEEPRVIVLNKADLTPSWIPEAWAELDPHWVSAIGGQGLAALRQTLRAALLGGWQEDGPVVFTPRQAELIGEALTWIAQGLDRRARVCLLSVWGAP